jgi:AP-3 complex subunit delta-1
MGSCFLDLAWSNTDRLHADLKATALLKLIYLEMFGHDMSWASFHVLEVMSSAKYLQKRVGYLGAVQSFRQDTEVLMLATNLLKKVRFGNYKIFKTSTNSG